jgi:hypothetical protein
LFCASILVLPRQLAEERLMVAIEDERSRDEGPSIRASQELAPQSHFAALSVSPARASVDRDAERQKVRHAVAEQYGLKLYAQYTEEEAAVEFLRIDVSTLKRWRRTGRTSYVRFGDRAVRYLGVHIADLLAFGVNDPCDESSRSANIRSGGAAAPAPGIASGMTRPGNARAAAQWARRILK